MALWTRLPLVLCLMVGCGKEDKPADPSAAPTPTTTAEDDDKRCLQLAKLCGDKAKHVDKILEECKAAAKQEAAAGCTTQANAAYACFQEELCGKKERVWGIADLDVLAKRHGKCESERAALRSCIGK